MSKSTFRELRRLTRQEREAGTLNPFDAARKAELQDALVKPAIALALEKTRPQIAAAAAAMQQAEQRRAEQQRLTEWGKRQAAAWLSLQRSQSQQKRR